VLCNLDHQDRSYAVQDTEEPGDSPDLSGKRRMTRRAGGGPVRRFPERIGIHGADKLKSTLWQLKYVVNNRRKAVMEFERDDWKAFQQENELAAAGFARNAEFGEYGLELLEEHKVERTLELPTGAIRQLEQRARKLKIGQKN